jgi:hypothetical protein
VPILTRSDGCAPATLKDLRTKRAFQAPDTKENSAKYLMAGFLLFSTVCTRRRLLECDPLKVWQLSRRLSPRAES